MFPSRNPVIEGRTSNTNLPASSSKSCFDDFRNFAPPMSPPVLIEGTSDFGLSGSPKLWKDEGLWPGISSRLDELGSLLISNTDRFVIWDDDACSSASRTEDSYFSICEALFSKSADYSSGV